ncbi:hypothetical protein GCM10009836_06920 [Pseudonocardia ailaonensis]|uniref:Glycosyltransferase 2-like domain-containing protein n=1 Tax=Pseudonocardia ailaonensis TaxID=367279 RepID=A0ABN2MN21_9PSEU
MSVAGAGGPALLFQPMVSVVATVTDGEAHVGETIGSVLDQTEREFELVLFDNASRDDSHEIMRSFSDPRIRVVRGRERLSASAARNQALSFSQAPLVKAIGDGDLLHPRCLELQSQPLLDDPGLAVVAARRHVVDDRSRVLVPRRGLRGLIGSHDGDEIARKVVRARANLVGEACAVLFRREAMTAAGGWRGGQEELLDLDCWLRLLQHGDFLGMAEPLASVRMHGGPGRAGYADRTRTEQAAIGTALTATVAPQVRGTDRVRGAVAAPFGAVRRAGVGFLAARSERRREREERREHAASG